MRITFRTRLLGLAGIAAVAFLLIIVASSVVAARVERQLAFIQRRYVPKLELEPQLQGELERLGRAFQDAVATERMGQLIDALLSLSRVTRVDLRREPVNLSHLADAVMKQLRASQPERVVDFDNEREIIALGDAPLLRALVENLIGNAWKFNGGRPRTRIAFGVETDGGTLAYYVRDNGAGFDVAYAQKLFAPFQRLHTEREFAGTGIGLATVHRIVRRHGGRIWADGKIGQGATFHFTLPNTGQGVVP